MKDLKQQNPNLNFNSSESLRHIAEDLTKAIKIGPNGDVIVDSAKIDPRCLNLKERKIRISQDSSEIKEGNYS